MKTGFIEYHHIMPISDYYANAETTLSDLALVCANCHRMLHRAIGVLTIEQLKNRIRVV